MPTRDDILRCGDGEWPAMLRHREDAALFKSICDLATKALDTERDAALGAVVRIALPSSITLIEHRAHEARLRNFLETARLYDAIAAHLRKEQKGET